MTHWILSTVLVALLLYACGPSRASQTTESMETAAKEGKQGTEATEVAQTTNEEALLITDAGQVDAAVGKLVTVRGEVANSRIPTIYGVDVVSDEPDLRGQQAQATGILRRHVVTQKEIDDRIAAEGQFAHRGPGTFYRLEPLEGGWTAQVERPSEDRQ